MLAAALEPFQSSLSAAAPVLKWASAAFRENAARFDAERASLAKSAAQAAQAKAGREAREARTGRSHYEPTKWAPETAPAADGPAWVSCVVGAALLKQLRAALSRPDGSEPGEGVGKPAGERVGVPPQREGYRVRVSADIGDLEVCTSDVDRGSCHDPSAVENCRAPASHAGSAGFRDRTTSRNRAARFASVQWRRAQ